MLEGTAPAHCPADGPRCPPTPPSLCLWCDARESHSPSPAHLSPHPLLFLNLLHSAVISFPSEIFSPFFHESSTLPQNPAHIERRMPPDSRGRFHDSLSWGHIVVAFPQPPHLPGFTHMALTQSTLSRCHQCVEWLREINTGPIRVKTAAGSKQSAPALHQALGPLPSILTCLEAAESKRRFLG